MLSLPLLLLMISEGAHKPPGKGIENIAPDTLIRLG